MRVKTNYFDDSGHQINGWEDWCYRTIDRYTNYGVFIYQTMEFNQKCSAEFYNDPQTVDECITNLKYHYKYEDPKYYGITYTPAEDGIYISFICPSMYGTDTSWTEFIKYPDSSFGTYVIK